MAGILLDGAQRMIIAKHQTRTYTSIAALKRALAPYADMGKWMLWREDGYSRSGRKRPQYCAVIFDDDAVNAMNRG